MRLPAVLGLFCLLTAAVAPDALSGPGDYYTRLRANDAPVGGRLTVHAFFLDSLDAVVESPGPGRVLALRFDEANGKGSFIVPGDLSLTNRSDVAWRQGFQPLGEQRLSGFLAEDEERWALWWVPDSLSGGDPASLRLVYGFNNTPFVPLAPAEAKRAVESVPWDEVRGIHVDPGRPVGQLTIAPDPAAFDDPPRLAEGRPPEFPKSIRIYDFSGSVHVVAVIDEAGQVVDAYVIESNAIHLLNVSALCAVMDWRFYPGTKSGRKVAGEIVVPVRFDP